MFFDGKIESVLDFMTHRIALVDLGGYNFVNYSVFECLEPMVPLKPWILTVDAYENRRKSIVYIISPDKKNIVRANVCKSTLLSHLPHTRHSVLYLTIRLWSKIAFTRMFAQ